MFAAPFDFVFNSYDQGNPVKEILDIPYRGEERIFIKPEGKDKVTVVYAINFVDPDDVIIGKVFLSVCYFYYYYYYTNEDLYMYI